MDLTISWVETIQNADCGFLTALALRDEICALASELVITPPPTLSNKNIATVIQLYLNFALELLV